MRCLIYSRFSSDAQRLTSIVDQERIARARAAADDWTVTLCLSDEAVSGSVPVALRPGGKRLMQAIVAGEVDVLILEGLDRLSRDSLEQEKIVRIIEHRGVRVLGVSDGYDSRMTGKTLMRGMRGLINQVYLQDLAHKTHRGLAGQFSRGLSAGGRSYGYRTEDAGGAGRRMVIDEAEAVHVRWIFEQAATGMSVRAIAHRLNTLGVPSPRGGTWAVSALFGSAERGLGLMNNEIYRGRVIWNRRQWVKDPETGSRRYLERPRSEWQERDAPELRIVSEELWNRAHGRDRPGPAVGTRRRGAIPKTLFGGLLTCAACGGPMIAINRARYGCGVHKDRGATVCASGATFLRDVVDRRLVAELRADLLDPGALAELQAAVRTLATAQQREAGQGQDAARKRLQALQGEIGRLVDAVVAVGHSDALAGRLRAAEAERAQIEAALAGSAKAKAGEALVENVSARWRRIVLQLQQVLDDETDRAQTRRILAGMLGPVTLLRDEETGENFAELEEPAERLLMAAVGESLEVVARARNGHRLPRRRLRL